MEYHCFKDGERIEDTILNKFNISKELIEYNEIKKKRGDSDFILNFVGFVIEENRVLISFPKHFMSNHDLSLMASQEINENLKLLFYCFRKYANKGASRHTGMLEEFNSYYPFSAYFRILDYYKNFGFYVNENIKKSMQYPGKISWKDTIQKSPHIINNGNIIYSPFITKKKIQEYVFISKCMAYVLNNTHEKFSFFLNLPYVDLKFKDIDFSSHSNIISRLRNIKKTVFKEVHNRLINDLITFFEMTSLNGGKQVVLVSSEVFQNIWESLVIKYLNLTFVDYDSSEQRLIFDRSRRQNNVFTTQKVYNPDKLIQPIKLPVGKKVPYKIKLDYFLEVENKRYIFDAKYYQELNSLDYKQISYYFLTREHNNPEDKKETYSALLLPTEGEEETFIHFQIDPTYVRNSDKNFHIAVHYLNVKKLMKIYIEN